MKNILKWAALSPNNEPGSAEMEGSKGFTISKKQQPHAEPFITIIILFIVIQLVINYPLAINNSLAAFIHLL